MKTKRYWLRGGIIALLIAAPFFVYGIYADVDPLVLKIIYYPLMPIAEKAVTVCWVSGPYSTCPNPLTLWKIVWYICLVAYPFVIGALLGWLYGKIKNRNKIS